MTTDGNRIHLLLVAGVLAAATGCTSGVGPSEASEHVIAVGTPSEFLLCAQPPAAVQPDTQVIGPAGGQLTSGANVLMVPRGALEQENEFVIQPERERVGIRVQAREPVRFATGHSATLTIDLSHCQPAELGETDWSIWRMAEQGGGDSQRLRTFRDTRRARAQIDSTSGFMIAN